MKKLLIALGLVFVFAGPASPIPMPMPGFSETAVSAQVNTSVDSYVNNTWACTSTSDDESFSMSASMVSVSNVGSNEVFIRFDSTAATASTGIRIEPGQTFTMQSRDCWSRAATCICTTAETTTVILAAYR